jgi:hypothetical protein
MGFDLSKSNPIGPLRAGYSELMPVKVAGNLPASARYSNWLADQEQEAKTLSTGVASIAEVRTTYSARNPAIVMPKEECHGPIHPARNAPAVS